MQDTRLRVGERNTPAQRQNIVGALMITGGIGLGALNAPEAPALLLHWVTRTGIAILGWIA